MIVISNMLEAFRLSLRRRLDNNDQGVSPVIGTMMMVAVTVVLAATVITIVNRNKGATASNPTNAAWAAQAYDSDGNGATDHVKLTYITGPKNVPNGDIAISFLNVTGSFLNPLATNGTLQPLSIVHSGAWNPGDVIIYKPASTAAYTVTVTQTGNTVLDQSIATDE